MDFRVFHPLRDDPCDSRRSELFDLCLGGGRVGCCTMIEIARMALSYCLKKLRKIVFLNIMDGMILRTGQSAPSAEQFKAFK